MSQMATRNEGSYKKMVTLTKSLTVGVCFFEPTYKDSLTSLKGWGDSVDRCRSIKTERLILPYTHTQNFDTSVNTSESYFHYDTFSYIITSVIHRIYCGNSTTQLGYRLRARWRRSRCIYSVREKGIRSN